MLGAAKAKPQPDMAGLKSAIQGSLLSCGLNQNMGADHMGLDRGQFNRELGKWGPSIGRLLLLPPEFWADFLPKLAELAQANKREPQTVAREAMRAISDLLWLAGRVDAKEAETRDERKERTA